MSKERLLVASAAETQLLHATDLLNRAIANLTALQHGVQPALEAAKKALKEAEKAHACAVTLLDRIPVGEPPTPSRTDRKR